MPLEKIGMVFSYNKPKLVSGVLPVSPVSPVSIHSGTSNIRTSNIRTSSIRMVQTIKRNTNSMVSIVRNVNQKCSSCGT